MLHNCLLPNIFEYLSILLIVYFISYVIGKISSHFILGVNKFDKSHDSTFVYLTLGFVFIVIFFAIIWTKANTVFVSTLFLIPFLKLKNRHFFCAFNFSRFEILKVLQVLILYIFIFSFFYYFLFIRSEGALHGDFNFYANVSNNLEQSHIESTSWFMNNSKPSLYHYSELWFNVFISIIFKANHLHVLLLVVYPFLFGLILIGAFSLTQRYFSNYFISIILSLLLVFFNPITTFFLSYQLAILNHPKFFVIAILMLFSIFNYLEKEFQLSFVGLMLLISFNSVISPGILFATFVIIMYLQITKQGFTMKLIFNKYQITVIFFLIFLAVFYVLRFYDFKNSVSNNNSLYQFNIEYIARSIAYVLIRLLPILLIIYFLNKRLNFKNNDIEKYRMLIIWGIAGALISSVIGGVLMNINIDGAQVSLNFTGIVLSLIIFPSLLYVLTLFKPAMSLVLSIILLVLNVSFFESDMLLKNRTNKAEVIFYDRLKTEFKKKEKINFGYFRNYNIAENQFGQHRRLRQVLPLNKIQHVVSDGYYAPYTLSVFDIPNNINPLYDERRQSELWKYVEQIKNEGKKIERDESIKEFIHLHKIEYIIIERNANIPDYLLSEKIIAEYEGNKIIKLKLNR